jgi:DNA-binding beta-propeller fold protein YncE
MTLVLSAAGHAVVLAAAAAILSGVATSAAAQVAVSANDNKLTLVDGVQTTASNPAPDTVTVIDLSGAQPRILGEVRAPTSIVGPPSSAAIAPDGSIALVTGAQRIDPANPRQLIPSNAVSVIDLKASPIAVIGTLHAGAGASGVSVNKAGTLALVANRMEGTISVFSITGRTVTPAGKVDLGAPQSGPSAVVFTPDGRTALVTRNNDSLISILSVDGTNVAYTKRDVGAGFKPYGIEVAPAGDVAIVGNIGAGTTGGGIDVVNVIDLTTATPRVIAHVPAGPTVEGVAISPDGRFVAATVMNGSNSPRNSPLFNDFALLKVFSLTNKVLTPVAEARLGHWCQGAAWSRDSKTVLAQCAVEREVQVFTFDGRTLTPATALKVGGGPSGIRSN